MGGMRSRITDAELRGMAEPERRQALAELVRATRVPSNGAVEQVNARIASFEKAHGMTSDDMRAQLRAGRMAETLDVCSWLMALKLRERIGSR